MIPLVVCVGGCPHLPAGEGEDNHLPSHHHSTTSGKITLPPTVSFQASSVRHSSTAQNYLPCQPEF